MRTSVTSQFAMTAFDLPDCQIDWNCHVVRGIVVRSGGIVGHLAAGLARIVGGAVLAYTSMCEQARVDAFHEMLEQSAEQGGNAVMRVRYDANEIAVGVTEVIAYGAAVSLEVWSQLIRRAN